MSGSSLLTVCSLWVPFEIELKTKSFRKSRDTLKNETAAVLLYSSIVFENYRASIPQPCIYNTPATF